jgi:hypothetical protein
MPIGVTGLSHHGLYTHLCAGQASLTWLHVFAYEEHRVGCFLCVWHLNMWMYSITCSLMGLGLWGCEFVAASTSLPVSLPKTRPRHARDFAYQAACVQ